MKTENKKSNQTCFQNSNFLKMKTVFRKWKQKMKTENENANQTHPKCSHHFRFPIRIYRSVVKSIDVEVMYASR